MIIHDHYFTTSRFALKVQSVSDSGVTKKICVIKYHKLHTQQRDLFSFLECVFAHFFPRHFFLLSFRGKPILQTAFCFLRVGVWLFIKNLHAMKTISGNKKTMVRERINRTLSDQKNVYDKILKRKPLEAEEDEFRKIAYINRQIGVDLVAAKKIADYVDPTTLGLPVAKVSQAESIQGPTVDFIDISFLDLARAASRSVARIVHPDGQPEGTGFMISPALLMTNNHVIASKEEASYFQVEFNYELDWRKNSTPFTRFTLKPDVFFFTAPEDSFDFSIIAIGDRIRGTMTLEEIGFLPLLSSPDKHVKGMCLNCIQHPNGDPKQLVIRENRLLARTEHTLIYSSDTLPGASGSPVFNDDWEVVALHHWGEPYRAVLDNANDANELPRIGNEGIRISSIVTCLKERSKEFDARAMRLLEPVFKTKFRQPSIMADSRKELRLETYDKPGTEIFAQRLESVEYTNPQKPVTMTSDGKVSFTIPLTVSVQLGQPVQQVMVERPERRPQLTYEQGGEKLTPDAKYSNRKGYDPNFLGQRVDLPKLKGAMKNLAAKVEGTSSIEFKYEHFSIVMNAERRLPFFTAVNIDGGSVLKIDRKTGVVTRGPEGNGRESAEAREKWYDDPRINAEEACHDDLYVNNPEMRQFQRGHLVKRTDPSWGTEEKALRGQADTFHFTNCAPQHAKFNPNKSRWAGLEDWITNTSDDENIRVTVFSGPVFDNKDYKIDYLQIPEQFWKVIVWSEDGELKSVGMLADQSFLIAKRGLEGFEVPPDRLPEEYHCRIDYLQELTKLDLSEYAAYDTYPRLESGKKKHRVTEFAEIFPERKKFGTLVET